MKEEALVLGRASWAVLILAFLADTAHIRSIPAYNAVIGAWGLYLSHYYNEIEVPQVGEPNGKQLQIVNVASTYSIMIMISILIDVAFCITWGSTIMKGQYNSLKFALSVLIFTSAAKVIALYFTLMIMEESNAKAGTRISPSEGTTTHEAKVGNVEVIKIAKSTSSDQLEFKGVNSVATNQQADPLKIEEGKGDMKALSKQTDLDSVYQVSRRISFQQSLPAVDDRPLARRPRSLQSTPTDRLPVRRIRSIQSSYFEDESDEDDPYYGQLPIPSPGLGYQKLSSPLGSSGLISPFHMKPPGAPLGNSRAFMSDIKKMAHALNLEDESRMGAINYKR